jgi:murein DD-endopeptidase MepM/ murein hydrolase activator NlpD
MIGYFGRRRMARLGALFACLVLSADALACSTDTDPPAKVPGFTHPAAGKIFTKFGPRFHPLLNLVRHHDGIDYLAKVGDPILAAASGEVAFAGWRGQFGIAVQIRHRGGWETFYAHLSRPSVRAGDCVRAGDVIGLSGNTGFSTGPHLHFEISHDGSHVDPATLLDITGRECVLECPADPDRPCACEPEK